MVAISFSVEGFPEMILSGKKDQTIRPFNKKRYEQIKRIGKLQLYWKQRTKECYKIADAEVTEIFRIKFVKTPNGFNIYIYDNPNPDIATIPSFLEIMEIVLRDGFKNKKEMIRFFRNKYGDKFHDMEFMVIRWRIK